MKKIYSLVAGLLFSVVAYSATFNLFTPANGVLKGDASTYVTTPATSTDVKSLWSGTCDDTTYLRGDGSCQTPPGTGGGTVNSVALSAPSVFSVSGSPVTTSGTLGLTFATGQTANQVLASPDSVTGAITLRSLVAGDLPTVPVTKGGSGVTTLTGLVKGNGTSAFTSALAADVYGLWSGTCDSTSFLRGDGACASPGTGTVTSVALTVPSGFSVTGSPVTTSGTLAISGTLNPAAGGTGVATLTGIAKGNGTSAFTAAVSGDVRGLWGGTCDATTYLRGDGSCATPASGGTLANPTASVGLSAVNGSAITYMRSDAAPALSQSIAPTWTGIHTFSNTTASTVFNHGSAAADAKNTVVKAPSSGGLIVSSATDAAPTTSVTNALALSRSGSAWSSLTFGNATDNPTYSFAGTGAVTFGGTINGAGSGITALNASNLSSGTVASARVAGSYTGITGVGTLTAGTWNGTTIAVANGGSGATTLTGLLKGNGTSAFTSGAAADVYGLWSGTCSASTYLRGDGTCDTPAGAGSVTSVAMSVPSFLSVSGSPITSSGTLAVTLSGTALPVANGGTGVTTSTGTGSVVLSSSPTLVTPALGTPSAAVLTNATGLPLTTGVTGILPAANGGTANGFTAFSGPATSTKTFTLPNASATVLTDNATVTVAQGGTGAATLTGYVKGNGTAAFTASATIPYSDITGAPTIPTGANPSASVGLTANNGSAATFMRSDGTPALSQSISPTWTGNHFFNGTPSVGTSLPGIGLGKSSTNALMAFVDSGGATDAKLWYMLTSGTGFALQARDDAGANARNVLLATRSGGALTNVAFGNATNNPTYQFNGTGTASFGGAVAATGNVTGANLSGTNTGDQTITLTGDVTGTGTGSFATTLANSGVSAGSYTYSSITVDAKGRVTAASNGAAPAAAANPSASVGLSTVNGSASTYMRSDAAPALSQSIAPTWTGTHTFGNTTAQAVLNHSGAALDAKNTRITSPSGGGFIISSATDAAPTTAVTNVIAGSRTGAAWSTLSFGNATDNPTYTFSGTGAASFGGNVSATGQILAGTSSVIPIGSVASNPKINGVSTTADNKPGVSFGRFTNDASPAYMVLGKSRGTTAGSYTVVANNDELGRYEFAGADGTDLLTPGASIAAFVDGTPGSNDLPTRLVISTTADGAATPTARITIGSAGNVTVAAPGSGTALTVSGTVAATAVTGDGSGLTALNAANVSSGTLAVARGGTGVTTSTGTGNVVLSTSPTLTTPALGTPSAAVLTNATGLPLTTGVTGLLPATNGGTANGFTAFSGPTTSTKTFTLPDASATILTDSTAVTAVQGGTGQTGYTTGDILYASSTTALSKLGAGSSGQVLTANGAGAAPSWQASGSSVTTGTFSASITGCSPSTSVNYAYRIVNSMATVWITSASPTCTSNTTGLSITFDAAVLPATGSRRVPTLVVDNGSTYNGYVTISSGGTATFSKCNGACSSSGFTASGGKGFNIYDTYNYSLD